jgi:hypothetical protein
LQFNLYVAFAVRLPVDWEPETAFAPDQPTLAVQPVVYCEDHERVAAVLYGIVIGPSEAFALISTVGYL